MSCRGLETGFRSVVFRERAFSLTTVATASEFGALNGAGESDSQRAMGLGGCERCAGVHLQPGHG